MIRKRIVSTKIQERAKLSPLPPKVLPWIFGVCSQCAEVKPWGWTWNSWGPPETRRAPSLHLAGILISPRCIFLPYILALQPSWSQFFGVFLQSDSWKSFCPTSFCWCDALFLFPLVKQTFVTDKIFTAQDGWNMEPETKNRFMLRSRSKPPSKTKQNTIIQYCFSIATANG